MDIDKISKFIIKKREECNLTQQELADKLHVSVKTVSKWECGRGIPDIGNMQELAKIFKISITELLNGEEAVIEYIDYDRKKNKKKYIISSIFLILIFIVILLSLYFINNYGKTEVYLLSGSGDRIYYNNLVVIKSNSGYAIITGEIGNDFNNKDDYHMSNLYLKTHDGDYVTIPLYSDVLLESNLGSDYFGEDAFDNIDDWELKHVYVVNNEVKEEIIKLKKEKIVDGKKFIKEKSKSKEEISIINDEKIDEYYKKLKRYLKVKGFNIDDNYGDYNIFGSKLIGKDEEFFINTSKYHRIIEYTKKENNIHYSTQVTFGNYYTNIMLITINDNSNLYTIRYNINEDSISCNRECNSNDKDIAKEIYLKYEEEFYELDLFDRDEQYNNYGIVIDGEQEKE